MRSQEARKKYDDNLIQRLHNEVLELNNLKVKNITRLGRKQDRKDRPTKVTLESTEDKTRIMQRLHKLHDADETYRNISVSHDLTRDERNEVRKLVEEAKEKNEKEGGLYVHKVIPHSHYSRECASVRIDAHSRIRTIHTTATMRSEAHSMSKRSEAKRSEAKRILEFASSTQILEFGSLRSAIWL